MGTSRTYRSPELEMCPAPCKEDEKDAVDDFRHFDNSLADWIHRLSRGLVDPYPSLNRGDRSDLPVVLGPKSSVRGSLRWKTATKELVTNKDQISGKTDQTIGRVKQAVGKAAGKQGLSNERLADQAEGAAKETWGNAKEAVTESAEETRKAAEERANAA